MNPLPENPNRFTLRVTGMPDKVIEVPVSDQYQLQAEDFGRAIRRKAKLVYGPADAVKNMQIIEAFFRAEKSNKWEKVKK